MNRRVQIEDYKRKHEAEVKAGGQISIDYRLPYIAMDLTDGSGYFFQGEVAEKILRDVPEWLDDEVYLLMMARSWG